jgi:hypothetical protein
MSENKSNIMSILAATSVYANAYANLQEMEYTGSRIIKKSPMTKKQKKSRAKAKNAKQARKRNKK